MFNKYGVLAYQTAKTPYEVLILPFLGLVTVAVTLSFAQRKVPGRQSYSAFNERVLGLYKPKKS